MTTKVKILTHAVAYRGGFEREQFLPGQTAQVDDVQLNSLINDGAVELLDVAAEEGAPEMAVEKTSRRSRRKKDEVPADGDETSTDGGETSTDGETEEE